MRFDYPVFLDLTDVSVVVVGAGQVGLRKAQGLAAAGAQVTVVAPVVAEGIEAVAVHIHRRVYSSELLAGSQLVVTATDDPAVNAQVAADAKAARIWVNSADDPDNCTFILPAVARAGRTTVAVSTGGASPALAQHLRDVVAADVLTPEVLAAADTLAAERDAVHAEGGSTEGLDWATRLRELLPRA